MSEFELGVMAGWVAGVVTAGAIAGALDWWSERNRVVTIHTGYQACAPVGRDDSPSVEADEVDRRWDPVCPQCQGVGLVSDYDKWFKPGTPPCKKGCPTCKGTGVVKAPPKKP